MNASFIQQAHGLFAEAWPILVMIIAVTAVAGFVQGLLGVGYPTIATPLLALVMDTRQAALYTILPIVFLTGRLATKGGKTSEALRRYWFMPVLVAVGVYLGLKIFLSISATQLTLALALLMIIYLILDLSGKSNITVLRNNPIPVAAACAIGAGVTESAVNIGSPFLLLFCLLAGLAPLAIVQVLNWCFFIGKSTQAIGLFFAGISGPIWLSTLPLVLIAWLPMQYGASIRERSDAARYKTWLRIFIAAMSVVLLFKALVPSQS